MSRVLNRFSEKGMRERNWHKWAVLVVLAICCHAAWGQEVTATLTSRVNRVEVGRPFEIELSVRHPERTIVVFPDTAKDFAPYEVESGMPLPTMTDAGISEDRKIYMLYTWEIDSVQKLLFPVRYLTEKGDTQKVMSNEVLVEFLPKIHQYSDTLKVQIISDLAEIREPINWVAWGIIFTAGLLIILIGVLVFSRPIGKWLKRMRIEREFRKHLDQLQRLRAAGGDQSTFYPGLNKVWRSYFDRHWSLALGSMTTQELAPALLQLKAINDEDRNTLLQLARSNDLVLYAGQPLPDEHAMNFWKAVHQIMLKEFQRRKEAVEV